MLEIESMSNKMSQINEAKRQLEDLIVENRTFIHEHIGQFNSWWEIYAWAVKNTNTIEERNEVLTRMRKSWLAHIEGKELSFSKEELSGRI